MKKVASLFVTVAFLAGAAGLGFAQTSAPAAPPAEKPAEKKAEKTAEKKMPTKTATGTVKSASADSVVVAGKEKGKEAEWTFGVDAKTKVTKGGKSAAAADLQAGDSVSVKYMAHEGKNVAQSITAKAAPAKKAEAKPAEAKPAEKK